MPPRNVRRVSIPSAFQSPRDTGGKFPILFQILGPDQKTEVLPEAMYLHVNPNSFETSYSKSKATAQTRGGFQEQEFGDELSDISADQSTGAFINIDEGLAVHKRRQTIAYRKTRHLKELFQNNGSVYDDEGNVVFRGRIRLMFEGGVYDGYFEDIDFTQSSDEPFAFELDWDFKVQRETRNLLI
jgi:hypothetical protein